MNFDRRSALLVIAIICFVLAALRVDFMAVQLVPLGLAALAGAALVADGGWKLR